MSLFLLHELGGALSVLNLMSSCSRKLSFTMGIISPFLCRLFEILGLLAYYSSFLVLFPFSFLTLYAN